MDIATADMTPISRLRAGLRRRLAAAGIHVLICACIYAVILYVMLTHWYPGFHFTVDGGWQGARIMAMVDLVVGPLLTLIVFNPFKARHLIVLDLSCIAVVQLGALAWGFYAVHSQHPVAVSFQDGSFYSVTAEPLKIEKADAALLSRLSDRKPALVYVAPPAGEEEETRAALQEIVGGVAPHEDPFFFRDFRQHWPVVLQQAETVDARSKASAAFAGALPGFLAEHGGQVSDYAFFPYEGRYGTCTLAFTAVGEPVDALGCEKV